MSCRVVAYRIESYRIPPNHTPSYSSPNESSSQKLESQNRVDADADADRDANVESRPISSKSLTSPLPNPRHKSLYAVECFHSFPRLCVLSLDSRFEIRKVCDEIKSSRINRSLQISPKTKSKPQAFQLKKNLNLNLDPNPNLQPTYANL